jgi:1-deoxy-D-xylulose-5-phosphate reductoisomerase
MPVRTRRVIVLGSTGSIGRQTLNVISHLNALTDRGEGDERFEIVGLAAGSNAGVLREQHGVFPTAALAIADAGVAGVFPHAIRGDEAAERLVHQTPCDLVVAAMVGFAGVRATLAAVELGRRVALANKETLVAAGQIIVRSARSRGVEILPIDSEHSGLWQALGRRGGADPTAPPIVCGPELARATITASGGPFRGWSKERIDAATPEEALQHPTWSMGPKVTIDSASLMNKALELIEAHWLFGLGEDRLGVLVHPQSLVHAIAQWRDGSMTAQLAPADMRTPIQAALTFPRMSASGPGWGAADLAVQQRLEFESPDLDRFPSLALGYRAIRVGGAAGTVLNAANEVAARAFLDRRIPFGRIPSLVCGAMDEFDGAPAGSLREVLSVDGSARAWTEARVGG